MAGVGCGGGDGYFLSGRRVGWGSLGCVLLPLGLHPRAPGCVSASPQNPQSRLLSHWGGSFVRSPNPPPPSPPPPPALQTLLLGTHCYSLGGPCLQLPSVWFPLYKQLGLGQVSSCSRTFRGCLLPGGDGQTSPQSGVYLSHPYTLFTCTFKHMVGAQETFIFLPISPQAQHHDRGWTFKKQVRIQDSGVNGQEEVEEWWVGVVGFPLR